MPFAVVKRFQLDSTGLAGIRMWDGGITVHLGVKSAANSMRLGYISRADSLGSPPEADPSNCS
jgi:hypothetical protein